MNRFKDYIDAHIKEYPTARYRENEPMSEYTSFRIGGAAPVMFFPDSEGELVSLIRTASRLGVKPLVIGKGTNLLVRDGELSMPVIQTAGLSHVTVFGDGEMECACGAVLAAAATAALKAGLSGLEFAHGIPGSVGGAVLMNAGAYGGEMKDVVTSVRAICPDGETREFSREDCDFSYRHSRFSDSECVILSAKMKLCAGDVNEIKARMEELSRRRRDSQPLNMPSAGSTFKRPVGGYAAALIDEAGLKGFSIGGAQVSEKHAGFVVNKGGATFDDVCRLIEHIQKTVYEASGIELEPEVKIIGR